MERERQRRFSRRTLRIRRTRGLTHRRRSEDSYEELERIGHGIPGNLPRKPSTFTLPPTAYKRNGTPPAFLAIRLSVF